MLCAEVLLFAYLRLVVDPHHDVPRPERDLRKLCGPALHKSTVKVCIHICTSRACSLTSSTVSGPSSVSTMFLAVVWARPERVTQGNSPRAQRSAKTKICSSDSLRRPFVACGSNSEPPPRLLGRLGVALGRSQVVCMVCMRLGRLPCPSVLQHRCLQYLSWGGWGVEPGGLQGGCSLSEGPMT